MTSGSRNGKHAPRRDALYWPSVLAPRLQLVRLEPRKVTEFCPLSSAHERKEELGLAHDVTKCGSDEMKAGWLVVGAEYRREDVAEGGPATTSVLQRMGWSAALLFRGLQDNVHGWD